MKIAVLSLADDSFREYRDISFPNKAAWCWRHNYEFMGELKSRDPSRPASWSKILMLAGLCRSKSVDWAFWTDADSLVMRMDFKIESLIDGSADFIVAKDENGINCGQFALRICDESKIFLDEVYAQTQFLGHRWFEQAAVMHLLAHKYPIRVSNPDKVLLNAYPDDYRTGYSAIIHLPGNPRWANRLWHMRNYAGMIR